VDSTFPSLARSEAHAQYLSKADSHVAFLDSDVLVQGSLAPVFASDFDVALTYRALRPWPINSGVMLVNGRHLDRGRAFFERTRDLVESRYRSNHTWGGDQDALEEQVAGADCSRTDVFLHQSQGLTVLMLPCSDYNFSTPRDDSDAMLGPFPDKKVLHFKGRRKASYYAYWEKHLGGDRPS